MGSSWTQLHLLSFPVNTLCCSSNSRGWFMPRSASPLTPQTPRGAFSSLNSLLTPFTAYFWERIDLLSGFLAACCGGRSEKKKKTQRDCRSLDSGDAGLSGDAVEALDHICIHPPVLPFTRRQQRWPHRTPTCSSRERSSAEGYFSL